MKKRVFLLGLLFLVGLSVLLYPLISSEWNRHRSDAMIDSYTQTVSQAPAEDRSAWIDSARQYNAALGGQAFSRRLCQHHPRGERRVPCPAGL